MSTICESSVAFYGNIMQLTEDLKNCDPLQIEDYLEYLKLNTNYIEGEIINIDFQEEYVRIYLKTVWESLLLLYPNIANYYSLQFVFTVEAPDSGIYINTDINGNFLNVEYCVFLNQEENAYDTIYEQMFVDNLDPDIFFSDEKEMLLWFNKYRIAASSFEELKTIIDTKYIDLYHYEKVINEKIYKVSL